MSSQPVRWRKLGLLFEMRPLHARLMSHAANPVAVHLGGDHFRVLFSARDGRKRSSIGFVDVDLESRCVEAVSDKPLFEFGPPDSFYSHGVSIGNIYRAGGRNYLLFMGWHIPDGGHWRGEIGRLRVNDDFSLDLDSQEPLMGLSADNPLSLSYPWVIQDPDGRFQMWYGSTITWDAGNGEMLHVLKHAVSDDGHVWRSGQDAIPYEVGVAQAFSRPTVFRDGNALEMWFSYRGPAGQTYRIGSARKAGTDAWTVNTDRVAIDVSNSGWDGEMIEYPFVFEHAGQRYMLYNGNSYGASGFGLAVAEIEAPE